MRVSLKLDCKMTGERQNSQVIIWFEIYVCTIVYYHGLTYVEKTPEQNNS